MSVTEAARKRMIASVQSALARHLTHGRLWFNEDGTGGAWYSDNAIPPVKAIVVRLRPGVPAEELVDDALQARE